LQRTHTPLLRRVHRGAESFTLACRVCGGETGLRGYATARFLLAKALTHSPHIGSMVWNEARWPDPGRIATKGRTAS
jgi:hypothetical protein